MKHPLLFVLFVLVSASYVSAQEHSVTHPDPSLYIHGNVVDYNSSDSIPFPVIRIEDLTDHKALSKVVSDARGKYDFYLRKKQSYRISYAAPGYMKKSVMIDLMGVPDSSWADDGMTMKIQIALLKKLPGLDESLFEGDIARSSYDPTSGNMIWDLGYTEQMRVRTKQAYESYRKAQNEK